MVSYTDYKFWRAQGLTALTAFLIAKYGFMQVLGELEGCE